MAEAMRQMGRSNALYRASAVVEQREGDFFHPLADKFRDASCEVSIKAADLFRRATRDELALFTTADKRTPEDWRREGERAARCFEFGAAFVHGLEQRAQLRRRVDAAAAEVMLGGIRVLPGVVVDRPADLHLVAAS